MGWSEGQGIGKTQGIVAPVSNDRYYGNLMHVFQIESVMKTDRRGLGSTAQNAPKITISLKDKRKEEILEKTRQRFDQVKTSCFQSDYGSLQAGSDPAV
jgi:hypothetical protein